MHSGRSDLRYIWSLGVAWITVTVERVRLVLRVLLRLLLVAPTGVATFPLTTVGGSAMLNG
ncbi:hypothetical protein GCM10007298_36890 [Williamsia phyllosphaerae]|uniref:Uncharacterized protein n=1 Tax=Williamsia phyllosphaerae TaxID=885042 RepID=A0ABQ1V412_9NOCA|nr:hypothetical protein GCM10007298_36890 [Williamsia phyllosphaerae]